MRVHSPVGGLMVRGIVAVVLAEVLATRVSRRKSRPGVAWPVEKGLLLILVAAVCDVV